MSDVYFQGEKLPPLRPNKVYGMQIYPGGRKVVRQCNDDQLSATSAAVKALMAGRMVYVRLDDAVDTLQRWQQAKAKKEAQQNRGFGNDMSQEDRDRILQLVAYVRQAYHGEYRRYAQIPTALIDAHELCNDVVKSIGWVSAHPSIAVRWSEEATCFDCPCGAKDIVLSAGGDADGATMRRGATGRARLHFAADRLLFWTGEILGVVGV